MRFLILISLVGCSVLSPTKKEEESVYSHSLLEVLHERFLYEAKVRGTQVEEVPIMMVISSLDGYYGLTYKKENLIIIDNEIPIIYLEEVVFHELGHLYLNREHTDSLNQHGIPASIMNNGGALLGLNYYSLRNDYLNELFKK